MRPYLASYKDEDLLLMPWCQVPQLGLMESMPRLVRAAWTQNKDLTNIRLVVIMF